MKWSALRLAATTALVTTAFPRQTGKQAMVRRITVKGATNTDAIRFYPARPELKTIATRSSITAPGQTDLLLYVDVDVVGGHVVKGHTVANTDFVIVATSTGLAVRAIATVANVSGKGYCCLTVATIGTALVAGDEVYIVRAADVVEFVSTVTATPVTYEDFLAGFPDAPLGFGATGTSSNIAVALVEYLDAG